MAFIDSTSAIIDCVLTRKGKELLAKNDGSFKIAKYALSDDEINYQLYNVTNDDDSQILSLPILEPSSNEKSMMKYKLVTIGKGTTFIAIVVVVPDNITLSTSIQDLMIGSVTVSTLYGNDSSYNVYSRDATIAIPTADTIKTETDREGIKNALLTVKAVSTTSGSTIFDIVGNDTGSRTTLLVNISSRLQPA
jgi:hypothetical protein